jgi:DNA-binding MarR family transcriptional regulator
MKRKIIDQDVEEFIDEYIDNLISWAIIVFYYQNPGARDRVSDLARHLGRREEDVQRAADFLVAKGFLKKMEGEEPVYIFEPSAELKRKVAKFVAALEQRDTRLSILSKVLG